MKLGRSEFTTDPSALKQTTVTLAAHNSRPAVDKQGSEEIFINSKIFNEQVFFKTVQPKDSRKQIKETKLQKSKLMRSQ